MSSHPDEKPGVHHVEKTYIHCTIHPGYTLRMSSTKRIGFNSNSNTETYTFVDFEYSHLIIITIIYSLKNKESTAFFLKMRLPVSQS